MLRSGCTVGTNRAGRSDCATRKCDRASAEPTQTKQPATKRWAKQLYNTPDDVQTQRGVFLMFFSDTRAE
jgi:hypothetical protein